MGLRDSLALMFASWALRLGGRALPVSSFSGPMSEHEQDSPQEYGDYIKTSNGVYACATGRATLLSSLPLRLYRGTGGERTEVERGPLYDLLHNVNPFWTLNRLVTMTELSLALWGEAHWFLERGTSGKQPPKEIWWARPDRVKVRVDGQQYIQGFNYYPQDSLTPVPYEPGEVIWLRYPNPLDEFSGLSPIAAARVAADFATDAMRANDKIFKNGLQLGGALFPKSGTTFTEDQAKELELMLSRRFSGADKAHRFGVFRFEADIKEVGINPKDAEYIAGLKWSLEDICRAYKWPLDLVGGQRTYQNLGEAMEAAWTHAVLPEAAFIAAELTEQLLPMFAGQADAIEFDSSEIDILQEGESERWTRAKEQITAGALTINEWRSDEGLDPVDWGDVWWAPSSLTPVENADKPEPPALPPPGAPPNMPPGATPPENVTPPANAPDNMPTPEMVQAMQDVARSRAARFVEYGGEEHRRLWERFTQRTDKQEKRFGRVVADLLRRQRDSVLAKLGRSVPQALQRAVVPFDMKEWVRKFREGVRPELRAILSEVGIEALADLGEAAAGISFDVSDPNVVRFLEQRVQRFAEQVNQTTWDALQSALAEGIEAGESIEQLAARVEDVMAGRIRSSAELIARTEVIGASNGGTLLSWQQSGVVAGKEWLAALDDRTRETHTAAHGQRVALDKDFEVGGGRGPAPGQIGLAEEDCNCRCTMTAVLD